MSLKLLGSIEYLTLSRVKPVEVNPSKTSFERRANVCKVQRQEVETLPFKISRLTNSCSETRLELGHYLKTLFTLKTYRHITRKGYAGVLTEESFSIILIQKLLKR